jgi:hypothetical protein
MSKSAKVVLEHDPEKPAPGLTRGGGRFSEKIMLKQKSNQDSSVRNSRMSPG